MNAQKIEEILNQAKVDKNGRIMNKGRLNDMLHSKHLKAVKNCSIPFVGLSLPDEDEINSMRLDMDCPTPNEEEYTTAGFKSGVRWLKNTIERQLKGQ